MDLQMDLKMDKKLNTIIEEFDGIRKDNSRLIFISLLIIIILDCLSDCF